MTFRSGGIPIIAEQRPDESTVPDAGGRPRAVRYGVGAGYAVDATMAAFGGFPLVFACVTRKAQDLAGLDLVIERPDGSMVPASDPIMRLFSRPTVRGSGVLWREQALVDLQLTGDSATRVVGYGGAPEVMSLVRIQPQRMEITAWADGQPDRVYWHDADGNRRGPEKPGETCILVRLPSWRDGPEAVRGTGIIEVLRRDLALDRAAGQRALESATKGRPDAIARPAASNMGPMADWTTQQREAVQAGLDETFARNNGGIAAVGNSMEIDVLGWSPKDLATVELSESAARKILAATGVPAHLIGYPIANTATPRDAERAYWMMLQSTARIVDDVLTNWLDSIPGYLGCRVYHDFSHVRALQYEQDSALTRAETLIRIGVRADVALAMQGITVPPGGWRVDPAAGRESDPVAEGAGAGPARRPSEGPGMEAPPADQAKPKPQGAQRADPADAPDPEGLRALARLIAGEAG